MRRKVSIQPAVSALILYLHNAKTLEDLPEKEFFLYLKKEGSTWKLHMSRLFDIEEHPRILEELLPYPRFWLDTSVNLNRLKKLLKELVPTFEAVVDEIQPIPKNHDFRDYLTDNGKSLFAQLENTFATLYTDKFRTEC